METGFIGAIAFLAASGLFCLKIVWNLVVPYVGARRFYRVANPGGGVSLMPVVELALFAVAWALCPPRSPNWPLRPGDVALIGSVMILGSYVHLVIWVAISGFGGSAGDRRDAGSESQPPRDDD